LENLVITGIGTKYSQTGVYGINCGGWNATAAASFSPQAVFNFRDIDFVWNNLSFSGKTDMGYNTGDVYCINANPENGCTINIENVRSNGVTRGYIGLVGSKGGGYLPEYGNVNFKNCTFYQDNYTTHARTGCPLFVAGWSAGNGGYNVTVDNCFMRSDACNATFVNGWTRPSETSNSLGCITLASNTRNNLTVTNSAFIGVGAVLNIDTTCSQVRMTNCDLYVTSASTVNYTYDGVHGFVTPGYFVNLSRRVAALASSNNQTTMTLCNLYGAAGSLLANDIKPATSRFVMVSCNDWSKTNAYAPGWIVTTCVNPGKNPGYGAMNGEGTNPGIPAKDFTVYNQAIKTLTIGANRSFAGIGVPVELSTFDVR
jgi:hypothetical protein